MTVRVGGVGYLHVALRESVEGREAYMEMRASEQVMSRFWVFLVLFTFPKGRLLQVMS